MEGLLELAKQINGKLTGFALDAVLKEHYETAYGFIDPNDPFRPLALVGESHRDGNYYLWNIFHKMRRFKMYEVSKYYGYNLTQFLELPREYNEWILEDLREDEERRQEAKKQAEAEAKRVAQQNTGHVKNDPSVFIPPFHSGM